MTADLKVGQLISNKLTDAFGIVLKVEDGGRMVVVRWLGTVHGRLALVPWPPMIPLNHRYVGESLIYLVPFSLE